MRGDHHHERRRGQRAKAVENREAVHSRHLQVQQQQVGIFAAAQRFDAIQHVFDLVAQFLQPIAQHAPDARVVVGDQHAAHGAAAATGRLSVKVLPWPGCDRRSMSPPCRRARFFAIASPRPLPGAPLARPR